MQLDAIGETVKVFIVKINLSLVEQDIFDHCNEMLTNYKRPKHVEFIDDLSKNNVGKELRKELRRMNEENNNVNDAA